MTVMMFVMMLSFYYFSRHVSATPSSVVRASQQAILQPRGPGTFTQAAPSPNMARAMRQLCWVSAFSSDLLRDGRCSLGRLKASALTLRCGRGVVTDTLLALGLEEKGKGPNEVLFSKDEVSVQGQIAWMPPSGLPAKYSFPKPLQKQSS